VIDTAMDTPQVNGSQHSKYNFTAPQGFHRTRNIRRKILPRRPTRDAPLVQDCSFYRSGAEDRGDEQGILVMVPHSDRAEDVPYYHPVLRKLAFRYGSAIPSTETKEPDTTESSTVTPTPDSPEVRGTISISILPFAEESDTQLAAYAEGSKSSTKSEQSLSSDVLPNRTYRTCLHLLETLHKHGWGRLTGYQKRVVHDVRRECMSLCYMQCTLNWASCKISSDL
jgi:tRNASer (uridine44-2'-O)-methyltransferase